MRDILYLPHWRDSYDLYIRGEVMKNQLIALLLALILLLALGLRNMDLVTLDFYAGSVEMPLVYLLAAFVLVGMVMVWACLLYTSPSPRDGLLSRMPSS